MILLLWWQRWLWCLIWIVKIKAVVDYPVRNILILTEFNGRLFLFFQNIALLYSLLFFFLHYVAPSFVYFLFFNRVLRSYLVNLLLHFFLNFFLIIFVLTIRLHWPLAIGSCFLHWCSCNIRLCIWTLLLISRHRLCICILNCFLFYSLPFFILWLQIYLLFCWNLRVLRSSLHRSLISREAFWTRKERSWVFKVTSIVDQASPPAILTAHQTLVPEVHLAFAFKLGILLVHWLLVFGNLRGNTVIFYRYDSSKVIVKISSW